MQSLKRKPETAKSFDLIKNEVEKNFKPNYDNRFGLTKNLNTVNNDYSEVEKSNHTRYFQKWRFKNRARFKRSLVSVFTLFVISFVSCGASDRPTEPDRLPFGVFPLNDVRWVESRYFFEFDICEPYMYYDYYDTVTYSVRQVGENKAELHRAIQRRMITMTSGNEIVGDTTWNVENDENQDRIGLIAWIHLEGRKVYWQGNYFISSPDKKLLFYDFSLNIGDTFNVMPGYTPPAGEEGYPKYYLASIDSILIDNEYRKKYNFVHIWAHVAGTRWADYNFSVIEGIGCDRYFFYVFDTDYSHNGPLIKVYYKDKLIWRQQ